MTKSREDKSLDELFRSSFEALPDTPAANGWDQPSPRVWEEVRQAIQPRSGWTGLQIAGASLLITLVATVLYFQIRPEPAPAPGNQAAPGLERKAETPAVASEPEIAVPQREQAAVAPGALPKRSEAVVETPALPRPEPAGHEVAVPLPGTEGDIPPNTTERRKLEIWKTILQPLPMPLPQKIQSTGQN